MQTIKKCHQRDATRGRENNACHQKPAKRNRENHHKPLRRDGKNQQVKKTTQKNLWAVKRVPNTNSKKITVVKSGYLQITVVKNTSRYMFIFIEKYIGTQHKKIFILHVRLKEKILLILKPLNQKTKQKIR